MGSEKSPAAGGVSATGLYIHEACTAESADVSADASGLPGVDTVAGVPPVTRVAPYAYWNFAYAASARLSVHPTAAYLRSCYPIDVIWQTNQPDREPDNVALEAGDFYFEVRGGQGLSIRRVPHSIWAFRSALASGLTFGQATVAALEVDGRFDLSVEIVGIFAEALIVGLERGV